MEDEDMTYEKAIFNAMKQQIVNEHDIIETFDVSAALARKLLKSTIKKYHHHGIINIKDESMSIGYRVN